MLKFLLGPLLVCAGYAAGSYCGSDAEQLVRKSPTVTYAAFNRALTNVKGTGMTSFDGGKPVAYEVKIDRTPDHELQISLLFGGQTGAVADVDFEPAEGGASTNVVAHLHSEGTVLRPVLAGTSRARLAYAPDWMLNLTFKPLLEQLAGQVERGELAHIDGVSQGEAEAQWESSLSEDQRNQVSQWRQYDATRPSNDPDAAAQHYLGAESSSN